MSAKAIVCGGSRGIGRVCAARLAELGFAVAVLARSAPREPWSLPEQCRVFEADLGESDSLAQGFDKALAWLGGLNHLLFFQRFRGDGDAFEGEMRVGVYGVRNCIERAVELFEAGRDASITLAGSVATRFVALEQPVGYHAAKSAQVQMMRFYAASLGRRGIRVNMISPGTTLKPEAAAYWAAHPELMAAHAKAVPLGRMGRASDVADVVQFLIGPGASFVTGNELVLDGGAGLASQESLAMGQGFSS